MIKKILDFIILPFFGSYPVAVFVVLCLLLFVTFRRRKK